MEAPKGYKVTDYIRTLVDLHEKWSFRRQGKTYFRNYVCTMHVNKLTGKTYAAFGYYKKGEFHRMWFKGKGDAGMVHEDLMLYYHNHIDILTGKLKLVKVRPSLLEDGYAPLEISGKILSEKYWFEIMEIISPSEDETYNLNVETKGGKVFTVSSKNFVRAYPMNWFKDIP